MRLGLSAFAAFFLVATPSYADDMQACVEAHEHAQHQKNSGKLVEAEKQLLICARNECPNLIRQDCAQWTTEVMQNIATVIPAAKDSAGKDLAVVKLSIDGTVVADLVDGRAMPIDPGIHMFRFEAEGKVLAEEQIVVRQGEKNRVVSMTLMDLPPKVAPEAPSRGVPVLGIVLAGAGVVAGGIGLGLGLSADSDARNLRDTCAPNCTDGQVDDVRSSQNVARVVGIVGGVMFAAGAVITVLHYTSSSSSSSHARIRPTFNGAALTF